jgi:hypothetical protein
VHIQKRFLLAAALALLPVDRCSAQFFTPVSTTMEAETWYFNGNQDGTPYDQALVQGPDDNENLGDQTGTLQASSQLTYSDPIGPLTSTANGSVTIDSAEGVIDVTLGATTDGGLPFQIQGSVTTTIIFDVPPNSGIDLALASPGDPYEFNLNTSELDGPNGLSWSDIGSLNIPSVPAGEYTLTCLSRTQTVTGHGFDAGFSPTIQIFPEPEESALAIGVMSLLPLRRRRG